MPEPESKDPKEESDQNETSSSSEEDAGSLDENAPEEQKPAPTGRSGLVRHIVLGVLLVAALAGLRIVDELGADTIWHYVRGLSRQLLDGLEEVGLEVLTPTGDEERGGIVAFSVQDAAKFNQSLTDLGILAGQYLPGQIRMDVALFHDEEDIQRTLRAVEEVAARFSTS